MARVVLGHELSRYADGTKEVEIDCANVRQLKRELARLYPLLAPHLDSDGLAIAIDGQIFQDAFLEPIRENSEVYFLNAIAGG